MVWKNGLGLLLSVKGKEQGEQERLEGKGQLLSKENGKIWFRVRLSKLFIPLFSVQIWFELIRFGPFQSVSAF